MRKLFYCLLIISINSCALFDGYQSNLHSWYHASLSKEEIAEIDSKGYIFKQWHGTNKHGDYSRGELLVARRDKKHFYFIENGTWHDRHTVYVRNGKQHMKETIEYDNFGNILNQFTYIRPVADTLAEWKLFHTIHSSVTDSLRQKVTYYHDNGIPESVQFWTEGVYRPEQYDFLNYSYMTKWISFDRSGNKTDSSTTHARVQIWYEPGVHMKKKK